MDPTTAWGLLQPAIRRDGQTPNPPASWMGSSWVVGGIPDGEDGMGSGDGVASGQQTTLREKCPPLESAKAVEGFPVSTFQDGSRAPRDRWSAGLPPAISLEPRAIPPDQRQAMLPSRPPTIIRRGRWVRRPPQVCAVRAGLPNRCSTRACCAWAPACDEDTRVPMHSQTSAERGGGCLKCAKLCARARAGQNPTVRALASETGERRRACRAS